MQGTPAQFEAIGNRLGFQLIQDDQDHLKLVWRGPRFPAFLCLGIALALLTISIPIVEAIREVGLNGAAGALWYFPIMNLILFGIAVYLIFLKRMIVFDDTTQTALFTKASLFRNVHLKVPYQEIRALRLGRDQVYSGFAVAGSSAAETFPVPSLRLETRTGSILVDRGSVRRLRTLGERISGKLQKPFHNSMEHGAARSCKEQSAKRKA